MIKISETQSFSRYSAQSSQIYLITTSKKQEDATKKPDSLNAVNPPNKNAIDIEAIFQNRLLRQLRTTKQKND
jgi:hypothetical protein